MRIAATLAAVAVASICAAPASATSLSGLHDARYCEIIELKGAPQDASAIIWNTIGLNRCAAAWWRAFDAGELAQELGDTAVVLNGPRRFLMDSVTATPGRVRSFQGQRLRKVATIPIRTAADLAQTPYTDRTIERDNTWRWRAGRRVYELVAPGGDVYVMQSYAQIHDPQLKIGKLRSLGRGLDLPPGWRYRTRILRRDLVVELKDARATGTVRLLFPRGSISGTLSMPFTVEGNQIHFRGSARFTGGTGAFRGISSGVLQARDDNTLDGQNGVVSVKGFATY